VVDFFPNDLDVNNQSPRPHRKMIVQSKGRPPTDNHAIVPAAEIRHNSPRTMALERRLRDDQAVLEARVAAMVVTRDLSTAKMRTALDHASAVRAAITADVLGIEHVVESEKSSVGRSTGAAEVVGGRTVARHGEAAPRPVADTVSDMYALQLRPEYASTMRRVLERGAQAE
jgi:hypothetical protein